MAGVHSLPCALSPAGPPDSVGIAGVLTRSRAGPGASRGPYGCEIWRRYRRARTTFANIHNRHGSTHLGRARCTLPSRQGVPLPRLPRSKNAAHTYPFSRFSLRRRRPSPLPRLAVLILACSLRAIDVHLTFPHAPCHSRGPYSWGCKCLASVPWFARDIDGNPYVYIHTYTYTQV